MKLRYSLFRGGGCGFLLATCLVTCCFLAINSTLVQISFAWLSPLGPALLRQPRVAQLIMFAAPVVLVGLEWWLADYIVDRLTPANGNGSEE